MKHFHPIRSISGIILCTLLLTNCIFDDKDNKPDTDSSSSIEDSSSLSSEQHSSQSSTESSNASSSSSESSTESSSFYSSSSEPPSSSESSNESSSESSQNSSSDEPSSSDYQKDPIIEAKVDSVLALMNTKQKVGQMIQGIWFQSDDIENDIKTMQLGSVIHASTPHPIGAGTASDWAEQFEKLQDAARSTDLKIPLLIGIDAVHGNAFLPGSVVFPHNIGLGAANDIDLVKRIGEATAKEVAATGINWTFGPVANMSNNEMWGRMYESFGESEALVTPLSQAIVAGLQGADLSDPSTIAACAKHYLGDGVAAKGHERGEATITSFGDHYAPYEKLVEMGIGSIMAGFTEVNGVRMHHNQVQLDYLKKTLKWDGVIVTDWVGWTIGDAYGKNKESLISSVNSGIDILMAAGAKGDTAHHSFVYEDLLEAAGSDIPMSRIDDAVKRILRLKFRLGLFESTDAGHAFQGEVGSTAHIKLAREAVQKSLTILKNGEINDKPLLPLSVDGISKIAVVGKHAHNTGLQSGGWTRFWQGNARGGKDNLPGDAYKEDNYATDIWLDLDDGNTGTTILDGIKELSGGIEVAYDEIGSGSETDADIAIVVVGEYPYAEWLGDEHRCYGDDNNKMWENVCDESKREYVHRLDLSSDMLGGQLAMIEAYSDIPLIVIMITGRPIPSDAAIDASDAFAVAWLPGSEGAGVADVLFGKAPASAHLPHAWISSLDNLPVSGNDESARFPFGHGITYDAVE